MGVVRPTSRGAGTPWRHGGYGVIWPWAGGSAGVLSPGPRSAATSGGTERWGGHGGVASPSGGVRRETCGAPGTSRRWVGYIAPVTVKPADHGELSNTDHRGSAGTYPCAPDALANTDVALLVKTAAGGDQRAWDELVRRFARLVWSIPRGYGLDVADAADVSQTVWLRLIESLSVVREPSRIAAWLVTVAQRESLRMVRARGREIPEAELAERPAADPVESPETAALTNERHQTLWAALALLPRRCQVLLRALSAATEAHYAQIAEALNMAIGSIGPTRQRCLQQLRAQLAAEVS